MTTYLVDYENISDLSVITDAKKGDEICIIYTNDANVSLRNLERLSRIGVIYTFLEVSKTEKQALDFQLDLYLGYLIGQKHSSRYVIVSNDSGFNSAVHIGKRLGADVSVLTGMNGKTAPTMLNETAKPKDCTKKGSLSTKSELNAENKAQIRENLRVKFRALTKNKHALAYAEALVGNEKKDKIVADITQRYASDPKLRSKMLAIVEDFYN